MGSFFLIFAHYYKRAIRDIKEIALLIAIPVGIILFTSLTASGAEGWDSYGYNVFTSHTAPALMLSFQFFNSFFMFSFLYDDFESARRWRLLAAPRTLRTYVFPAFMANWVLNLSIGVFIIIICALFLNVYWSNLFVLAAVLMIISLMATFIAVLIFLFTKKLSQANAIGYIIAFGMMTLSGYMLPLGIFGENAVTAFLTQYGTPLSIGVTAIVSSGELYGIFDDSNFILPGIAVGGGEVNIALNIGILAAITLILGLITAAAAGRRKKI